MTEKCAVGQQSCLFSKCLKNCIRARACSSTGMNPLMNEGTLQIKPIYSHTGICLFNNRCLPSFVSNKIFLRSPLGPLPFVNGHLPVRDHRTSKNRHLPVDERVRYLFINDMCLWSGMCSSTNGTVVVHQQAQRLTMITEHLWTGIYPLMIGSSACSSMTCVYDQVRAHLQTGPLWFINRHARWQMGIIITCQFYKHSTHID